MKGNPVAYIRYRSSICPYGRKPITKRIIEVEKISPRDIIVAVASPARKAMHLHLDRETGKVYYIEPGDRIDFNSTLRRVFGLNGEFVTP
jgi:hypothetical protein